MLLVALLAPLLAAPRPQTIPDVDLLRLAPEGALAVARVNDVRGLLARRETSRWIAFLSDPAWQPVLADLRDIDAPGDAATEARAESVVADLVVALADARSAVAIVVGTPGLDAAPILAFAALGGEGLSAPLQALLREGAQLTREGALEVRSADGGVAEAYFRRGDLHFVIDAPDAETALAFGRAALARMDGGAPLTGRRAEFRSEVDAEFAVELGDLWRAAAAASQLPAEAQAFWSALASVDWIHGRLQIGAGEQMRLDIEAPYRDSGLAAQLFGAFRTADPMLLGLAPATASSASAGKADLGALARSALAEVEANAPRQHELILALLTAATEAYGVDVLGSLVPGLTGDYVSFSCPLGADAAEGAAQSAATTHARLGALDASCTAFRIVEPERYVAAIETALDATGASEAISEQSLRGADVWSTDVRGQRYWLAVHPRFLCLALDVEALERFLARVNGDSDAPASFLAAPAHAAAVKTLRGTYVSLASTRAKLAVLGDTLAVLGLSVGDALDLDEDARVKLARVLVHAGQVLGSRGHAVFSGLLSTQLVVEGGRILARTEAR